MATIRRELVNATINRSHALMDYNIQDTADKRFEFKKQIVLADISLTNDEKSEAIKKLNKESDYNKLLSNKGTKRICENCQDECLATSFCEHCVRNHLKENFSNWTSGNNDVDNLIQQCQLETLYPGAIAEWIPYNNLQNIKYLTKGGCSEIYTASWIGGPYREWDTKEKQFKRSGTRKIILKKLENVESANKNWLEEGRSHLTISNKWSDIVQCFGLTKDPLSENYMLVMNQLYMDLRNYLQQNHKSLTWARKIGIIFDIILAILRIHHDENLIHRDLHSGNVLFSKKSQRCYISDLGFCGPADKPLNSIYGNLPYIAPEVICGKETTQASDIYSLGMLMWEISSGQPPFINYEHDYDLAMEIVNGKRPKIVPGTPLVYKKLMEQCWDADLTKRPDISTIDMEISKLIKLYYQNESEEPKAFQESCISNSINSMSNNCTSKIYQFKNFPEPRNAILEDQEAFHSKSYNFSIPDNIDNFNDSSNENNINTSSNHFRGSSKKLSKIFKKFQINTNDTNYENDKKPSNIFKDSSKRLSKVFKKFQTNSNNDDIYNDPNLHSEDQDELEIPDDNCIKIV